MFDMEYNMTVGLLKMWIGNTIKIRTATMTIPTPYVHESLQ